MSAAVLAPLYSNYIARIKPLSVGRPVSCDCVLTVATLEAAAQYCSQFCNKNTPVLCVGKICQIRRLRLVSRLGCK